MGFCRRCGEIVQPQATRCRCGGSAVAPVVSWNQSFRRNGHSPDRWAKTYVSASTDVQSMPPSNQEVGRPSTLEKPQLYNDIDNQSPTRPSRRFPRPLSTIGPSRPLSDSRLSNHIASTTAQRSRTPSPVKCKSTLILTDSSGCTPTDVIASPDTVTLAKAYGSILQRPETLPIHTCARCFSIFPPDATIYPDPQVLYGNAPRFLCKPCFTVHGGSKGNCVSCGRDVLTIAREGGFIENAGRVWHKRCFRCEGCHKDLSHAPMVDLFGTPSCPECFGSCIDRKTTPKKKKPSEILDNIGGLKRGSRESSPALEELSERLGIKRQVSPELSRGSSREKSTSLSPLHMAANRGSPLRGSLGGSLHSGTPPPQSKTPEASSELSAAIKTLNMGSPNPNPPTPALSSSSSCSDSASSFAPSTPPCSPQHSFASSSRESITPKCKENLMQLKVSTPENPKCNRCFRSLFDTSGNGQIVTVPGDPVTEFSISYHASCFRCFICGNMFDGQGQDHAAFVKDPRGVCHLECITADKQQATLQSSPSRPAVMSESIPEYPPKSAPPLSRPFPRFGGSGACPGCRKSVSPMEYGVVPGPQNSRWHVGCLVCGGKGAKLPRPGCGKRLDSAAKTDYEGNVWCRECMLLLPPGTCTSLQGSPIARGLAPSFTGSTIDRFPRVGINRLSEQVTGSVYGPAQDMLTTQHTGGGVGLLRRGSISPTRHLTRSVSPTKGLMPVTRHPRPVGSWKHKSVDEGRGMFLVRQMTGNGQS